jgi:hypothetical protein
MSYFPKITNVLCAFIFICTLFFPAIHAKAATFESDDTVSITEAKTNLYASGNTVSIDADINKDLVVVGQTVTINKNVSGSVLGAAQIMTLDGNVGQNVRVAGEIINLKGTFDGDVVVAAKTINFDNVIIKGDFVSASQNIEFKGTNSIQGDSYVTADIDQSAIDNITAGTLKFERQKSQAEKNQDRNDEIFSAIKSIIGTVSLVALITYLLIRKQRLWTPGENVSTSFIANFGIGFSSFVITGLGMILGILLSSSTGTVGVVIFLGTVLIFILSLWYIPIYSANVLANTLQKNWVHAQPWQTISISLAILIAMSYLTNVYILGFVFGLFFVTISITTHGFVLKSFFRAITSFTRSPRVLTEDKN